MTIIQTTLAKDIEIENLDIRYDKSVKRVLANTPLLAPITKYTVRELKNYSIPMVEKCIDADSIQVSEVFVEPGLTNSKLRPDEHYLHPWIAGIQIWQKSSLGTKPQACHLCPQPCKQAAHSIPLQHIAVVKVAIQRKIGNFQSLIVCFYQQNQLLFRKISHLHLKRFLKFF